MAETASSPGTVMTSPPSWYSAYGNVNAHTAGYDSERPHSIGEPSGHWVNPGSVWKAS